MPILQLSVFLENSAGRAGKLAAVLEAANLSIRGFSLSDTGEFGIARIIVDDPAAGKAALEAAGFAAQATEVLCVELVDEPGELAHLLAVLGKAGVNIEYAYSLVSTYVALRPSDISAALQQLAGQPVRLVEQLEIAAAHGRAASLKAAAQPCSGGEPAEAALPKSAPAADASTAVPGRAASPRPPQHEKDSAALEPPAPATGGERS